MNKITFKKGLLLYTGILAVVIIIVCIIVWGKLSNYQKDYNDAKEAAQPEVFVDEWVSTLDSNQIKNLLNTYDVNIKNNADYINNHADYFSSLVTKGVTYKANENFSDKAPIYDVYGGDRRFAVISLKPTASGNKFGFRGWTINKLAFDTNDIDYHNIEVKVNPDDTVYLAGIKLEDDNVKLDNVANSVSDKAVALGSSLPSWKVYTIKDYIGDARITVRDTDGQSRVISKIDDSTYSCVEMASDEFISSTEARVLQITDAYINNIYQKVSFQDFSKYLVTGSDAYKVIKDVQDSIVWAWKPEVVTIDEQSTSDYVVYSDTLFSCKYNGKITKSGSQGTSEESFAYELLFQKVKDTWLLTFMALI